MLTTDAQYQSHIVRVSPDGKVTSPWGPADGHLSDMAVSPDGTVAVMDNESIDVLSPTDGHIERTWSAIGPVNQIALGPDDSVYVAEVLRGDVTVYPPTGPPSLDLRVGIDPTAMALTANSTFISSSNFTTVSTMPADGGPAMFTQLPGNISPSQIAVGSAGTAFEISPSDGTLQSIAVLTIPQHVLDVHVGAGADSLAVTPDGAIYTVNPGSDSITRVSPDGAVAFDWAHLGHHPVAIAATSLGSELVTANEDGTLSLVTGLPRGNIPGSGTPPVAYTGPDVSLEFYSPSGNISCSMTNGRTPSVWCMTAEPAESVTLGLAGIRSTCSGISCLGNAGLGTPTLAYGHRLIDGPLTCTSRFTGVTCTSPGGGFLINRAGITPRPGTD